MMAMVGLLALIKKGVLEMQSKAKQGEDEIGRFAVSMFVCQNDLSTMLAKGCLPEEECMTERITSIEWCKRKLKVKEVN